MRGNLITNGNEKKPIPDVEGCTPQRNRLPINLVLHHWLEFSPVHTTGLIDTPIVPVVYLFFNSNCLKIVIHNQTGTDRKAVSL